MRPKIIVITGIDGAGKTTHAKLLVAYLNERKISSKYVHLTAPNLRITQLLESKFGRKILNKENELFEDNLKGQSRLLKSFGLFFLFRGIYQTWTKIIKNRNSSVIVFDRYAYDDFVRVLWKYKYSIKKLVSLVKFVPKPDILFNLILSPEEAWEREIEGYTSLEQHRRKKNCHNGFISGVREDNKVVDFDVDIADVEKIQKEIRNIFCNEL